MGELILTRNRKSARFVIGFLKVLTRECDKGPMALLAMSLVFRN